MPADNQSTMDTTHQLDTLLVCRLCGESFVFSAGEQELLRLRGVDQQPTRCPHCRRRPPTLPLVPRTR